MKRKLIYNRLIKALPIVVFALILVLFIVGCGSNNITGRAAVDVDGALTADGCEDTDGGIDSEIKGTISGFVNGEQYGKSDDCIGGLLVEYYCEENKAANQNIRCEGKCLNGACV